MPKIKQLIVNENSKLFDKTNMFYKEFPSDFRQIRFFTLLIVQKAPPEIKEINLLEQQVSELVKNAVRHGNKKDPKKKIKIWTLFTKTSARIIVEDEGKGFQKLEEWNSFNEKRSQCFINEDFVEMEKYFSFRTEESDDQDGGNALFAALEYWDGGLVYNNKRNCVAVLKHFPKKTYGIELKQHN